MNGTSLKMTKSKAVVWFWVLVVSVCCLNELLSLLVVDGARPNWVAEVMFEYNFEPIVLGLFVDDGDLFP